MKRSPCDGASRSRAATGLPAIRASAPNNRRFAIRLPRTSNRLISRSEAFFARTGLVDERSGDHQGIVDHRVGEHVAFEQANLVGAGKLVLGAGQETTQGDDLLLVARVFHQLVTLVVNGLRDADTAKQQDADEPGQRRGRQRAPFRSRTWPRAGSGRAAVFAVGLDCQPVEIVNRFGVVQLAGVPASSGFWQVAPVALCPRNS